VIDTPGLFEVKAKESVEAARTTEVIARTIGKCLENEITGIHCIIMFITFEAGINAQDIAAMKVFLGMFGGSGVKVALCITHADKHNDSWKEAIETQLRKIPELSDLIENEKMEILFMGCVDTENRQYTQDEDLRDDYLAVYEMRKKMLEFIFSAKDRFPLNQMNVARQKIEQVASAMEVVEHGFKLFNSVSDFQTSQVQLAMITHKENIEYLSQNSIYINAPELTERSSTAAIQP